MPYMKSDKISCIIYADIESLIKKIDGCANNPENPSTTKIGQHISCGYSMSKIWVFDHIENKHTLYRAKYCMKVLYFFKRTRKNITDFEKKKMLPLIKEHSKSHQDTKGCYICEKNTFSAPIERKVTKINKDGNESGVTISYKIKFIDSARFMASSLSNLADNLAEGIPKIKCKDCNCIFEYENVKDNLIKFKFLSCNKDYSNKLDEKLKKRFKNTFKFSDNDINKFILLLRKGVYPYECMDEWQKFIELT